MCVWRGYKGLSAMVVSPGNGPISHPTGSVLTADLPSVHGIMLIWGTLAKERIVDASTLAS